MFCNILWKLYKNMLFFSLLLQGLSGRQTINQQPIQTIRYMFTFLLWLDCLSFLHILPLQNTLSVSKAMVCHSCCRFSNASCIPKCKNKSIKKKICSLIHSFEKKSATKRILFRKLEFQKSLIQLHEQRWIICLSLAILNSIQRVDLCLITEKEWRCTECNKWNEVTVLLLILRSGFSLLGELSNRSACVVDSLFFPWPVRTDYLNLVIVVW